MLLGAMLSHDNVTWSSRVSMEHYEWNQEKLLSYLPLSHVAACLIDCYMIMYVGGEVHFADKNALKGTLVL
jgi:long-chain-fatty-acid--CoA ligase ACSBG